MELVFKETNIWMTTTGKVSRVKLTDDLAGALMYALGTPDKDKKLVFVWIYNLSIDEEIAIYPSGEVTYTNGRWHKERDASYIQDKCMAVTGAEAKNSRLLSRVQRGTG